MEKFQSNAALRLWWDQVSLAFISTTRDTFLLLLLLFLFFNVSLFCSLIHHPGWLPRIPLKQVALVWGSGLRCPTLDIAHSVPGVALIPLNGLPFLLITIFWVCTLSPRIQTGHLKEWDSKCLPITDLPHALGGPHSVNFLTFPDCRLWQWKRLKALEKSLGKKEVLQKWQGGNSNFSSLITGTTLPICVLQLSKEESQLASWTINEPGSWDCTLNLGGPRPANYNDYSSFFFLHKGQIFVSFPETQRTETV